MRISVCAALGAALWLCARESPAQDSTPVPAADRVVYDAAYYSAFAPRTALDMVEQTPGFVLDAVENDERRGFAGAVGNVLIDGQRLGAKSQNLRDVLGRVAAKEVLRIEILRGAEVAGDASGAPVLANVVRTITAGGGTWQAGAEMTNEHRPEPNGQFGWSGRDAALEYSLGGNLYRHDHLSDGRFEIRDGDDRLIARKDQPIPHRNGEYVLNGQVALPLGAGKLSVTGQSYLFTHDETSSQRVTTPDGEPLSDELDPFRERTRTNEAGITWAGAAGEWDVNLTGLATRKQRHWHATATLLDADDAFDSEFDQDVRQRSGESIVRGTMSRALAAGRLEIGAETAINTLDGHTALTLDTGGGAAPVELPNADLRVKETRGEAFASHVWRLSDLWSLDSRLAAETSRLSFTGDTEQSVTLTYVKPRVQLSRKLGRHQLQVRAFRDVGQLDFTDFVSTAELANDSVIGGNPDLKPQTFWAIEVDADLRFTDDAALRVRAFRHFVDDVADIVPIGSPGNRIDAPGNIGRGKVLGAEISARVPLAPVLKGGTLNVSALLQDTEATDPVTGRKRKFSDTYENHLRAELRQDLNAAKLAWGATFEMYTPDTDYRLDETFSFRELRRLDLFVETTWIEDFKVRLEVQSALNGTEWRERRFYSPDRTSTLSGREVGNFYPGHWWLLTVSSTF
ncbi:MAG TPA: TonB-dependent receptor [Steroidobacteraceae bacterium]|nr:TonB-dependent receptor [Steroidobacteraceae bacterium]